MARELTYLDVVPEAAKEQLSRTWGDAKSRTFAVAKKHGIKIEQEKSFNKAVVFTLGAGYYHLVSGAASMEDAAQTEDVVSRVNGLIEHMAGSERRRGLVPLFGSNICDWDSAYAQRVGASAKMRDEIIRSCTANDIVLVGGETANIGEQLRKKGIGWTFTLLSRYDGEVGRAVAYGGMDLELESTFGFIEEKEFFEVVNAGGMPLLHVRKPSRFMITADGSGSKSIVCDLIGNRTDIEDTLASAGDDPTRDGAFPVIASICVHAHGPEGKIQMVEHMNKAGMKYRIPLVGSLFHEAKTVYTYTMNGTVLSRVKADYRQEELCAGLRLVLLYEEQRSNGITLQRRVLENAFGQEWYSVKASDALDRIKSELGYGESLPKTDKTLGELVARPPTPYFRIDSLMPDSLLASIRLRINVSSGGIVGKTRRVLEPLGLGAEYDNIFDAPMLILLLQMSSRLGNSKGVVTDRVSYHTWGCGTGAVIATTEPERIADYYRKNGVDAKVGGRITDDDGIRLWSRCFDSMHSKPHVLDYRYSESPIG